MNITSVRYTEATV